MRSSSIATALSEAWRVMRRRGERYLRRGQIWTLSEQGVRIARSWCTHIYYFAASLPLCSLIHRARLLQDKAESISMCTEPEQSKWWSRRR
jgi:hypothetical protein